MPLIRNCCLRIADERPIRAMLGRLREFLAAATLPDKPQAKGEATEAASFFFLSAFGFFFSRLLRIWPFAILSSRSSHERRKRIVHHVSSGTR
jgi:hypothetical protein